MAISQVGVLRDEDARSELRRYVLTGAVLVVNLAFAIAPAVVGALVLVGLLR